MDTTFDKIITMLGATILIVSTYATMLVFYKRIRKKTVPVETIIKHARVILKGISKMSEYHGRLAVDVDCFEVAFLIDGKRVIFEVSEYQYYSLNEGDEGLLVYDTNKEIISFNKN